MEKRAKFLIVVAGGQGSRMGSAVPKQFLELGRKAVLRRTIERFASAVPGIKVITVLPEEHIERWKDYCASHDFLYPQTLVSGGMTRFHSVRNALAKVPDGAIVAVHDGVRPFVSETLIKNMFSRMENCRALIPVLPSTDTLKVLDRETAADGTVTLVTAPGEEADRSRIFCAQTPQMFLSEDLRSAYLQAFDTAFTDDASVALKKGIPLSYTEGERLNIKITTPDDLKLAEAVLKLL